MAIPVILRGETARPIPLTMAEGHDYGGCELLAELCGIRRTFGGLVPGGSVDFALTADETAALPLGTSKLLLSLRNAAGEVRHLPWAKVKVTDCPGDARGAGVSVDPATLDVDDLTASDSLGTVKARLNAVLAFLRGAAALALLSALTAGADVAPLYTTANDLPGNAPVMTNAAEYVDALAVKVDGKADAADVRAVSNDLSSVASSVSAVWEQVFGESVWIAVTNYMRTTDAKPSMGLWERRDGQTNLVWSSAEEIGARTDAVRAELTNAVQAVQTSADAAKAWGKWQSADGAGAPDGFTMVTTPYLMLTGGGAWEQRTLSSGGSYWLFCGDGSVGGADETFKMMDSNGESVFEVTRGSVREVPAVPSSFKVTSEKDEYNDTLHHIEFTVYATSQPDLYYAYDLAGPWYGEMNDSMWTANGNGTYTARHTLLASRFPSLFFKAAYETGAEPVVDFKRPLRLSRVELGGTNYAVSVGVMSDGTKFLKLEGE